MALTKHPHMNQDISLALSSTYSERCPYLLPPLQLSKPIIPSAAETSAPLTSSQKFLGNTIVICAQWTSPKIQ